MQQEKLHKKADPSFLTGMFLGGFLGAVIIVVLGTQKGKKLIDKLQQEGLEWLDEAKSVASEKIDQFEGRRKELAEKSQNLFKAGQELQREIAETVSDARDDLSEEVAEKVDDTLAHIEKLQERGREHTSHLRKQLFKNIPRK